MKRILVTGGCGFIGSNLVKFLLKSGYEVSVIDNQQRGKLTNIESVKTDVKYYNGDVRCLDDLITASKDVDSIIHLAFVNGTKNFYTNPSLVLDIALRGILNVYDAAKQNNVSELFLASSSEVYQDAIIIPTPEEVQLVVPDVKNPRYSYGGSKILYELMSQHYYTDCFSRVITFRPHNIYGKNMEKDHVIPDIIEKIKTSKDYITVWGDGNQTRSFCYIDDFCDGILKIIENGKHKEIYNVGTDEETSIKDLYNLILGKMNSNLKLNFSPAPKGEAQRRSSDITKLKSLGYSPKIKLNEGIERILREVTV